jgi:hypothetical protein
LGMDPFTRAECAVGRHQTPKIENRLSPNGLRALEVFRLQRAPCPVPHSEHEHLVVSDPKNGSMRWPRAEAEVQFANLERESGALGCERASFRRNCDAGDRSADTLIPA